MGVGWRREKRIKLGRKAKGEAGGNNKDQGERKKKKKGKSDGDRRDRQQAKTNVIIQSCQAKGFLTPGPHP